MSNPGRRIRKILVANRGEIATRAFRAATQLDIRTVAIHTYEDRNSLHRVKADESYQIGQPGHPVRAYLDIEGIIEVAISAGVDALYPGYGFLSESPALASACEDAGIIFVGPPAEILRLTGNKMKARGAAERAGVPVLEQSPVVSSRAEAIEFSSAIGFPLFVKAAAGGGGRGLRRVEDESQLGDAVDAAMREAEGAFGDSTVFLEEAMTDVRHIEVQILGDHAGSIVHLYERDCSVQRRFQKVVEVAPAPNLDAGVRDLLCADAVCFAESIGYTNAGTVEFLVDSEGRHAFIEMNPRIQVEHTITEEITDIDLVESQILIAAQSTLVSLGITQDSIVPRGFALQCRVTSENPADDFRPDSGRLIAYRQPGGSGIRLDGGSSYSGGEISPYFDSLIVKVTARGRDFESAIRRAKRALAEFRVRGVETNLGFLQALLADRDFAIGNVSTSFIDDRPELATADVGADRATRLLRYLGDVTVNPAHGAAPTLVDPRSKLPDVPVRSPLQGTRQQLASLGPDRWAQDLRQRDDLAVTDTTLRDAHQSVLATRVRTFDLVAGAGVTAHLLPELLSLECWGGATYDVALRFLHENPWDRLRKIRAAVPNICLQMLLRGRNTVGYTPSSDIVCSRFVEEAHNAGIDIFRVFDALNDVDQMRPAVNAAVAVGAVVEGTLCYSGDLGDPSESLYDLDYYLRIAEALLLAGAHVLCVKDMAGLLRVGAAQTLVAALRERFEVPVHLHTHDTAWGQLATYLAAIDAGVDAVDGAAAPLAGMTSQPSLAAIVAATANSARQTELRLEALISLEPFWEAVRRLYKPFESGLSAPTGAVYHHEIPGGQLSNLRQQAVALGVGDRFEEVESLYAACDRVLGRPIKVTPTSKVVGDLALHLVASGVTIDDLEAEPESVDIPDSGVRFLRGELGTPEGGFPEPFRTRALMGRAPAPSPTAMTADAEEMLEIGNATDVLNNLLFPTPAREQAKMAEAYGDLSVLPTRLFFYGLADDDEESIELESGVRVLVGLEAVGEPNENGQRSVVFRVNGQLRPIDVVDRSAAVEHNPAELADPDAPGQIAAPFRGVVNVGVSVGTNVTEGETVATIEAMKIEAQILTPVAGTVDRIVATGTTQVEPGDLILVIRPAID